MKRDVIVEWIEEHFGVGDEILLADGLEDAFIGLVQQGGSSHMISCYDASKCIEVLMREMPYEDAIDHFGFNVVGGYVGPATPMFLERFIEEDFNGREDQATPVQRS